MFPIRCPHPLSGTPPESWRSAHLLVYDEAFQSHPSLACGYPAGSGRVAARLQESGAHPRRSGHSLPAYRFSRVYGWLLSDYLHHRRSQESIRSFLYPLHNGVNAFLRRESIEIFQGIDDFPQCIPDSRIRKAV